MWRIISVEADGTLKIVKKEVLAKYKWDEKVQNVWSTSSLNNYLNDTYYNSLAPNSKSSIVNHKFDVGAISPNNSDLDAQIVAEKGTEWTGNVGLITLSDYLRASLNKEQCENYSLNNANYSTCATINYLFNVNYYWMISPDTSDKTRVIFIHSDGTVEGYSSINYANVFPVVYLKNDTILSGDGTSSSPYIIN